MNGWQWPVRITDDDDTVDAALYRGVVTPGRASAADMRWCAEWLAAYACHDDIVTAQSIANVIGFLDRKAAELDRRTAVATAKRAYAAEHGVPVRTVRVRRG